MANIYAPTAEDDISLAELELYHLIMEYRAENGLPAIKLSEGLTITAGRHALDTVDNVGEWSGHSWSDAPYDGSDSSTWPNMWDAPQRLGTGYTGNGYEISTGFLGDISQFTMTPERALNNWQNSTGHNNVILNLSIWDEPWKAIGIGIKDGVAHVWFGRENERAIPEIQGTNASEFIEGTRFFDNIVAGRGNDTVEGGGQGDTLDGGIGADRVAGGFGDDLLMGGIGPDRVVGQDGDDAILGGKGNDLLKGGNGDDRFNFSSGDGNDRIIDFEEGDLINVRRVNGVDDFSDLRITNVSLGTLVEAGNVDILLLGVRRAEVDAGDFLI